MQIEAATRLQAREDPTYSQFLNIGLTKKDADMYIEWTHQGLFSLSSSKAAKFLDLFKRIASAVPKNKQDKIPSKMYRGMTLPKAAFDKLRDSKVVKLKDKIISSWTADRDNAVEYADDWNSVVVTAKTADVVLYIGPKLQKFFFTEYRNYKRDYPVANEHELIVSGSGVPELNLKNARIENP